MGSEGSDMRQSNGDVPPAEISTASATNAKLSRYAEIAAAVMLSIATVATAWCAYQSTRWSGVQATSFAEASTARVESTRAFNEGMQLLSIDANTFLQYVEAFSEDKTDLLTFYETRLFRIDFLPYFEEWLATEPLENPDAPRNPFVNEAYRDTLFARSNELEIDAAAKFETAKDANQTGDDYVLATVLFASVLFFGGISSKFDSARIQVALVILAVLMFTFGVIQVGGLPIE